MLNQKEYRKRYYQDNKEKEKERTKQWRKDNPELKRKYNKIYQEENTEIKKKCCKRWRENNPGHIKEYRKNNRERINGYLNNKYKTDLKFNINKKIRRAINLSLKGNKNGWHWEDLVSYTLKDLIKHLKETMPRGYDWQDYIGGRLHIDHKIPISAFNFTKPEHPDFKRCWALSNLQLLPAKENLVKNSKLLRPFQPALQLC